MTTAQELAAIARTIGPDYPKAATRLLELGDIVSRMEAALDEQVNDARLRVEAITGGRT